MHLFILCWLGKFFFRAFLYSQEKVSVYENHSLVPDYLYYPRYLNYELTKE